MMEPLLDMNARLWMNRAFELAGLARENSQSNPMVGAVIVRNGRNFR